MSGRVHNLLETRTKERDELKLRLEEVSEELNRVRDERDTMQKYVDEAAERIAAAINRKTEAQRALADFEREVEAYKKRSARFLNRKNTHIEKLIAGIEVALDLLDHHAPTDTLPQLMSRARLQLGRALADGEKDGG